MSEEGDEGEVTGKAGWREDEYVSRRSASAGLCHDEGECATLLGGLVGGLDAIEGEGVGQGKALGVGGLAGALEDDVLAILSRGQESKTRDQVRGDERTSTS